MSARLLITASIVLYSLLTVGYAQSRSSEPPYLDQFPTIERVKEVIKGNGAMDTAAKQLGAFWHLRKILEQLSGFRIYRNQMTAGEQKLLGQYRLGYQQSEQLYNGQIDALAWARMQARYTSSGQLRDEIFEKLLSPAVRELWAKTEGNTTQTTTALARAREQRDSRENGAIAVSRPAQAKNLTAAVGPADPSVAKAIAAKIDTRVAGLQLGDPLNLPQCNPLGFGAVVDVASGRGTVPATCSFVALDLLEGFDIESILPYKVDRSGVEDIRTIQLSKEFCPMWVTGCTAYGSMHNGRLVAVALFTTGRGVERTVTNELRAKYGPPTRLKSAIITPESGNPFRINDPEWILPGLRVQYEVVLKNENDDRVVINKGIVRIMTETEYDRRITKQTEVVKPKL